MTEFTAIDKAPAGRSSNSHEAWGRTIPYGFDIDFDAMDLDEGVTLGHLGTRRGYRADLHRDGSEYRLILSTPTGVYALTAKLDRASDKKKRGRYLRLNCREMAPELLLQLDPVMYVPDPRVTPDYKNDDRRVYLHRVLAGLWFGVNLNPNGKATKKNPALQVHHVDHDTTNNTLSNLQPVTEAEHAALHEDYRPGMHAYNTEGIKPNPTEDQVEGLDGDSWGMGRTDGLDTTETTGFEPVSDSTEDEAQVVDLGRWMDRKSARYPEIRKSWEAAS